MFYHFYCPCVIQHLMQTTLNKPLIEMYSSTDLQYDPSYGRPVDPRGPALFHIPVPGLGPGAGGGRGPGVPYHGRHPVIPGPPGHGGRTVSGHKRQQDVSRT